MSEATVQDTPDPSIVLFLKEAGLLDDPGGARFEALAGGVSSDIWKVTSAGRVFCVKRALPKLKVAADWFAPVDRNRFEVAWYRLADKYAPGAAPKVIAADADRMMFAMEYLDPAVYRLWKSELREERVVRQHALHTGRRLARIHAGSARDDEIGNIFTRSNIFHAIRLEPYLEAAARRHPEVAVALVALSRRTKETKLTMVHGDVSPKNILIGPSGPILLDAECACIGDPAFDLAFCLNHFLLKCLWVPAARDRLLASFDAMAQSYLAGVDWEPRADFEHRAATLLPGLFLARVDGKSPVEYVTEEADRMMVRRCAVDLLKNPPTRLDDVCQSWARELGS